MRSGKIMDGLVCSKIFILNLTSGQRTCWNEGVLVMIRAAEMQCRGVRWTVSECWIAAWESKSLPLFFVVLEVSSHGSENSHMNPKNICEWENKHVFVLKAALKFSHDFTNRPLLSCNTWVSAPSSGPNGNLTIVPSNTVQKYLFFKNYFYTCNSL